MHFVPNEVYHVYNRGNDKQPIFFNDQNYLYLLNKVREEWKLYCEILCYCLMPNHFHFMLIPNEEGCENLTLLGKSTHLQHLSKIIGKTLSSYTKAINIQNKTTGNLFQKKTKAKHLLSENRIGNNMDNTDYFLTCFNYIHSNPLKAGLVNSLKDWKYSSFPDYYGFRNGTLCNRSLAIKVLGLSESYFTNFNLTELDEAIIKRIF